MGRVFAILLAALLSSGCTAVLENYTKLSENGSTSTSTEQSTSDTVDGGVLDTGVQ